MSAPLVSTKTPSSQAPFFIRHSRNQSLDWLDIMSTCLYLSDTIIVTTEVTVPQFKDRESLTKIQWFYSIEDAFEITAAVVTLREDVNATLPRENEPELWT